MKTAFISGVLGQDGAYLAKFLLDNGYQVYGGARRSSLDEHYRLRVLGIEGKLNLVNFDLSDPYNVFDVISSGQFDEVYNLAAQSFVGASWDIPIQTSQVDAMGVLLILDAIKRSSTKTKFYQASTSEMFGLIQEDVQKETTPFYPRSPYGVAKLFAHNMTVNYRESFGLHLSSGILFNHESPLRGKEFVTKKITRQLAEVKMGLRDKISIGNLYAKRDWGYAAEYIVGMWKMLQQTDPDDYVLATGKTYSVKDFLITAAQALDIELQWDGNGVGERGYDNISGELIVEVDPSYYRPAEVDVLVGDASKAKTNLGWEAETTLATLAEMMVKFDLQEVKTAMNS